MVTVISKINLDDKNDERKASIDVFIKDVVEILKQQGVYSFPLGKILSKITESKLTVKKLFNEYSKPKESRRNDKDKYDWESFFREQTVNFRVQRNGKWENGTETDILYMKESDKIIGEKADNIITKQAPEKIQTQENNELSARIAHPPMPKIQSKMITETQTDINKTIRTLLEELNNGLYEKERSIRLTLLAVLAGESTFMLGEPGTAKSLVARRISEAFEDTNEEGEIKFFDYLMNQFSTPEEIFGPVSIQELKNDKYVRKTDGFLPKAQFAFLDEIWKANPAIQNALLTILNERIFVNGGKIEKVPLIGFMSASNELPARNQGLDAIFDRFLVRIFERPIADDENFRNMISSERNTKTDISKKLSKETIDLILKESEYVEISADCYNIIDSVRKALSKRNSEIQDENEKYMVSDRRWKKIANLMRVSAYCNGRNKTDIMDATLIADCIWRTETQEIDSKKIIADAIKNYGIQCKSDLKLLKDTVSEFENDIDDSFYKKVTGDKGKIVTIKSRKYYEVKDLNMRPAKVCYIACKSHKDYGAYYNSENKYYYFISDLKSAPIEIRCSYDSNTQIYKDEYGRDRYQVQMEDAESYLEKRSDLPQKMYSETAKSFEKKAEELKKTIEKAINQVDSDVDNQKKQFENNLFSDFDYYSKIVFKEQISTKSELKKLSEKLVEQRKRY